MTTPVEHHDKRATPFGLRLSDAERADLIELAGAVDRTPSQVVRRAIRFYRDHLDTVERALRSQHPESASETER